MSLVYFPNRLGFTQQSNMSSGEYLFCHFSILIHGYKDFITIGLKKMTSKPREQRKKILDLYCGAGGASMGYYQAGFEVVGVDIKPQPHYPFEFYQADALEYPLDGYDAYHASPPCQGYSKCTSMKYRKNHSRQIAAIRNRLKGTGKPYIIENVEGARHHLIQPIMLCGSMFGLPIRRHRYFEIWPLVIFLTMSCNHKPNPVYITGTPRPKNGKRKDPPAHIKRAALGTLWMTIKDMDNAIPPAYTRFIGGELLKHDL
jgi:DNA (cytosine-5)-methyltransferase 1